MDADKNIKYWCSNTVSNSWSFRDIFAMLVITGKTNSFPSWYTEVAVDVDEL
jgi:hypothetical protein